MEGNKRGCFAKAREGTTIFKRLACIALMSCAAKLYDKLLANRLRRVIEPLLLSSQAAYRKHRSTVQNILALRLAIDSAKCYQMEQHLLFVDFSAAFDSVDWDALNLVLNAWHVDAPLQKAIWSIIDGHKVLLECVMMKG